MALAHSAMGVFGALVLAALASCFISKPWLRRLVRNAALPDVPAPLKPVYPTCSDAELTEAMSFVVTVKDTCGQAEELLTHLASLFPSSMHVYYGLPNIRGCRHVDIESIMSKLFKHYTIVRTANNDSPIAAFLKVHPLLKTKYAVLMHNDAYPMERDFACESLRALDAHPDYPIVAPQIYERASNGIIVPHGHHENLHQRVKPDGSWGIDYDLSFDLLTARMPEDFKEGPQRDFLEDHAFVARTDVYPQLLDPAGSFTMEYMDMILNMRARNTSAWYVPTARCYFEVDTDKLTWEDIPYFVYKRSEQIGHQVRTYLTNKWGIAFPNTGIWNYVKYVFIPYMLMKEADLPKDWNDQAALFFSWFEGVGFNRYNGQFFPEFIEEPSSDPVDVSRETKLELPTDVLPDRVPPQSASDILPKVTKKKMGPTIAFDDPHIPIGLRISSCDVSNADSYTYCGLVVQDGDTCKCYTYVEGFNLRTTFHLDTLMAWLKLPPRAFTFAQMKYWPQRVDDSNTDYLCEAHEKDCRINVHFPSSARILQWSWYGKPPQFPFTPEGFVCVASLLLAILLIVIPTHVVSRRLKQLGFKNEQGKKCIKAQKIMGM
mmetsp:Transcript_41572/g.64983  ORF Transcript_41572/g.64983 Transcript_41572/m.64983 type:complete len:602 (+) Transcript_41572:46-1851(+)